MKLQLTQPLIFFDIEATGLNIGTDRIVELSYKKVLPNGCSESKTLRIKPTTVVDGQEVVMHIPESSTAIHGITDEDVEDCPTFKQVAQDIVNTFKGCDLAGYDCGRLDIPILAEELLRAGKEVDFLKACRRVDAFVIFQRNEPRNLSAAYHFYCGKELTNAHSANADTEATYEVLMAQLERYENLPTTMDALSQYTTFTKNVDFAGRLVLDDKGQEVFAFGKYKGQSVVEVLKKDKGYYGWLMNGDFPEFTKREFTRLYMKAKMGK